MDSIKMLEKDIQRACIDYLDAKRVMYLRLNAGDSFRPGANGKLYKVRGATKGTADLLVLATRNEAHSVKAQGLTIDTVHIHEVYVSADWPRPIFVEFKSEKGRQTTEQKEFEQTVKVNNYEYYLIRSLDELLEVLK